MPVTLASGSPWLDGLRGRLGRGPRVALAYGAVLLLLVALSSPRQTGDGGDYLALAHNLSRLEAPTFPQDLREIRAYFDRWGTGYENVPPFFLVPDNRGDDGRYDLQHFWFYPALVAPVLAVTDAVGVHPNYAFAAVNLLLLCLAAAVVARRLGAALTAVLFLGPVVWWVDKAQTEAFTFSVLAIAMASLRDRPGLALVCLGAAATQNPPFAIVLAIAAVAALVANPALRRDRRFLGEGAVGVALALLAPAYYELRLGRTSSLHGVEQHVPTAAELRFSLLDLNFGLVPNAPVIPLVVLVALVVVLRRGPRRLVAWDVAVAILALPVFLYAFSQSPALAAGGTPSMTRYALWLIPLGIPVLARVRESGGVPSRWLAAGAVASAAWTAVTFLPSRSADDVMRPTRLAAWVWDRHPGLEDPLAEVFALKTTHAFGSPQPSAVASCAKVLVVYGAWARCPVGPLPARCRARPCYANRRGDGYVFTDAPLRGGKVLPPAEVVAATTAPPATPLRPVEGRLRPGVLRVGGTDVPLATGVTAGAVDSSRVVGRTARFTGWAGDASRGRPAAGVVLVAGGRVVGAAPPTLPRPDVAQAFGAQLARAGFTVAAPLDRVQPAGRRARPRLFALVRGAAAELRFGCNPDALQDFGC